MPAESSFAGLLARVRQGDQEAAAALLREYEPQVRRVIRVRLTDPKLRRQMDSVDICQSVMGEFYVRMSLGQFEIESPEQLIKLLATMARNKLINHVHKQHAARRDVGRQENVAIEDVAVATAGPSPASIVANRELLERIRTELSPEERYLVEQREAGRAWGELATELGEKPDALRVRLSRALDRVAARLSL